MRGKNRVEITKLIRFEVFKRDAFKCGYCGKAPPEVVLEVDHIDPKSLGGSNDLNNLLTACFECNRGKKAIPLTKVPSSISENLSVLMEKESQISAYNAFVKKIRKREERLMNEIAEVFAEYFKGFTISPLWKERSLRRITRLLAHETILECMHFACAKFPSDRDTALIYFAGMCWKRIKGER